MKGELVVFFLSVYWIRTDFFLRYGKTFRYVYAGYFQYVLVRHETKNTLAYLLRVIVWFREVIFIPRVVPLIFVDLA